MPRYTVDLSEEAARIIEAEISAGRQPSAAAFLDELIREAQMHRANQKHFERLIDEGIESGHPIPVNDEFGRSVAGSWTPPSPKPVNDLPNRGLAPGSGRPRFTGRVDRIG